MAKNKPQKAWDWVVKEKKGNVNDYMDYVKGGEWKDDPVDNFMNEATQDDFINIANPNPNDMTEEDVREIQAGLNLIGSIVLPEESPQIEVDGIWGPKTYARWNQFYKSLPKRTQELVKPEDNPIVDINAK